MLGQFIRQVYRELVTPQDRPHGVQTVLMVVGSSSLISAMPDPSVLTDSQPSTSPSLSMRSALLLQTDCRYRFTNLEEMSSLVSLSTTVHT